MTILPSNSIINSYEDYQAASLSNGQTSLSPSEKDQSNNVTVELQDQIPKIFADEQLIALSPTDAAWLYQLCHAIIVQGHDT